VKGVRFTPTHSVKKDRRYRYYTSQAVIQRKSSVPAITRIPAPELESLVISQIRHLIESLDNHLTGHADLEREEILARAKDLASQWSRDKSSVEHEFVRNVVKLVIVGRDGVCIRVDNTKLIDSLLGRAQPEVPIDGSDPGERTITLRTRLRDPPSRNYNISS
jgi:site-specific DNA recombinase